MRSVGIRIVGTYCDSCIRLRRSSRQTTPPNEPCADFPNPPYADQAGDPQGTTRPLFRPFAPAANGASRTFPELEYIQNNANVLPATVGGLQTAENLPGISRQLNFNVTVRDGRGGVGNAAVQLDVAQAVPFFVTSPNAAVN